MSNSIMFVTTTDEPSGFFINTEDYPKFLAGKEVDKFPTMDLDKSHNIPPDFMARVLHAIALAKNIKD